MRRRRSRLIVAMLAAIVLGVALWFSVVLLAGAGTTQVYGMQRVSSSRNPSPSLSPTALTTATSTRSSAKQGSSGKNPDLWGPIGSFIGSLWAPIAALGALLAGLGGWLVGLAAWRKYKSDKNQEEKDKASIEQKGYMGNFCNGLKIVKETFSLEETTSNASTNPVLEDVYMDWEQDYISLRATDGGRSHCKQKSDIDGLIQREQKTPAFNFSVTVHEDGCMGDLITLLQSGKNRWVLLGGPGAGKTTYLKKITLNFSKENSALRLFEPIYVECKEFAAFSQRRSTIPLIHKWFKSRKKSGEYMREELYRFIAFAWEKNHDFPEKYALAYIREKVKKNKALFLLDGLDEIPLDGNSKQAIINYNQDFKELIKNIPRTASVIVTLRGPLDPDPGQSGYADLHGFSTLTLEDFTPKDMGNFVEKQKKNEPQQSTGNGTTQMERLKTLLGSTPRLQAFTVTPLLLHLITLSTKKIIQPLPASRVDIYGCCINNLFHRWNKKENIPFKEKGRITDEQQKEILGHLAWYLHHKKRYRCSWDDMWEVIQQCLPKSASSTSTDMHMLKKRIFVDIRLRSGFIKEDRERKNYYRFTNITMQEYFAAQHLIEQEKKPLPGGPGQLRLKDMLADLTDPWWEEVLLVYIKHAGKDTLQLLEFLAALDQEWPSSPPKKEFYAGLLLAGHSLVWNSKRQPAPSQSAIPPAVGTTFDEIKLRLYALLLSPTTTPLFVQEKVAKIFAEMEQEDIQKNDLEQLVPLKFPNKDYTAFQNRLKDRLNGSETVSPPMLPLLEDTLPTPYRRHITDYKVLTNVERRALFTDVHQRVDAAIGVRMVYTLMIYIYTFSAEEKRTVANMLFDLLSNSQIDIKIRDCMARALGVFGDQGLTEKLRLLLKNASIPLSIRWNIVTALGEITKYPQSTLTNPAPASITDILLHCLDGNNTEFYVQDEYLRWNIATTLIHTLYQDRERVRKSPGLSFEEEIVRHGINALFNDDYAASEIGALLKSLSTAAQTILAQPTLAHKKVFKDQYTCTCQMLEKLELTTDAAVRALEDLKKPVEAALAVSDPELVESFREAFFHLEWTIMKRKYMFDIID